MAPPLENSLQRVLIIHTDGNTFNNPTLKCIIDLLLENNCQIDLRYPKTDAPMPHYANIRFLPFGARLRTWKSRIFDRYRSQILIFLSVLAEKIIYYKNYDLILAVDRQGLIEASVLNRITQTPYVFISFEIMFEDETSFQYKSLERAASKKVAAWIIQDEVRAGHLQRENYLDPAKRILLPLASAGVGPINVDRVRDHLGIPAEKKIAIVIGSLDSWSMADVILKSVADWPDDWVLIVHARYGRTRELLAAELNVIDGLIGRKIFISDSAAVMVDDMGSILAGVAVGLAFYKPETSKSEYGQYIGKNIGFLGLASGKISTYLRYGIPVIMNQVGLYAEQARKFGFGSVVENPEQIKDQLNELDSDEFRQSATDYFEKYLDFNIHKEMIWSCFEGIAEYHNIPPNSHLKSRSRESQSI